MVVVVIMVSSSSSKAEIDVVVVTAGSGGACEDEEETCFTMGKLWNVFSMPFVGGAEVLDELFLEFLLVL